MYHGVAGDLAELRLSHPFVLLAAVALAGCQAHGAPKTVPGKPPTLADVAVGMPYESFHSIFPQAKLTPDDEWSTPGELYGLEGDWTYSFDGRTLSWFIFNSYESSVNQVNFNVYLDATRRAIADYTSRFGEPAQVENGVTEFRDPAQGYSGYPVLKASWVAAKEKININFSLLGSGEGDSQFLFTIETRR